MGRDIDAIKITGEDRRKYRDKVRRSLDVFARMLREHRFEGDPAQVGVEIELNLVDGDGEPSMQNADVLDEIADPADRLAVPVTVVWPEFDPLFPRAWSDRLEEFFSNISVHPVDGAGHFTPLECPAEFADAIHDALVATRATRGGHRHTASG